MFWDRASLDSLCGIAEAAGAAVLGVYARSDPGLRLKEDRTPLTEADLLSDRLIRSRLAIMFRHPAVVTEETPAPPGTDLAGGYFLVDPLDGTKEFLARNGEFTVNIAWVQGGRPLAGVVHAPALDETFWGAVGVGAWKRDACGQARAIAVAAAPGAGQPLRVLASRSHGSAEQDRLLEHLARARPPLQSVIAGSSLKFCRVAEAAADLYPRLTPTAPWDTAAGQAVLEAAGGVVLALDGTALAVPHAVMLELNRGFVAASCREVAALALGTPRA
jgi:3'(2'), 5'-bisphosphate nucleotidase